MDKIKYQCLADTYSAHVNPIFWKIHGWVEDRLEDWREANNLKRIPWKYKWEGGPMSKISDLFAIGLEAEDRQNSKGRLLKGDEQDMKEHDHSSEGTQRMEKVIRLLLEPTGRGSPLFKRVIVPNRPKTLLSLSRKIKIINLVL